MRKRRQLQIKSMNEPCSTLDAQNISKTFSLLHSLLADSSQRDVALRILYQLSTEDQYKGLIASSGCLPLVSTRVF